MDEVARKMSGVAWAYGDKDPAALAVLEQRIADTGRQLGIVTYSDLVRDVHFHLPDVNGGQTYTIATYDWSGLDWRIVGDSLGHASYRSYTQHGFMASSLVVNRAEFRPSHHFFEWMEALDVLPNPEENIVLRY